MSYLVANPEDRFSNDKAHMKEKRSKSNAEVWGLLLFGLFFH